MAARKTTATTARTPRTPRKTTAATETRQSQPAQDAPYVLTPEDAASFAHVRKTDDGKVIRDRFGAPMVETDRDGTISGAAMARAMGLTPTRAKSFRAWLRDKSLPRQVATAEDAARVMRAYQSRGARPVLSTDATAKDA